MTSLLLSGTSWWLLRLFTHLHWGVLFGGKREGISDEPLEVLFGMLGQLDLGYRLLALGALAFNIWAIWRGRPRWLGLVVMPPTLVVVSTLVPPSNGFGADEDVGFAGSETRGQQVMKADCWCKLLTQLSLVLIWMGADRSVAIAQTALERQPTKGLECVNDTWVATSLINAPSPRADHTAVWTGSEMIIWGGLYNDYHEAYALDTGARYDPATDTWTPTTLDGAPTARFGHTAVWTGTEMIIFGGISNTGARYDPSTNTWTPTSLINAPFPRGFHSAVWTGTEMIVWGGAAPNAGRYNPATDTWGIVETPSYQTRYPAAVWTGTEMIVWGGAIDSGPVDTGQRYDPASEYWTPTSRVDAPSARKWHTGVWTGSEMIVWGGYRFKDLLDTGGRYDPLTDSWTATRISPAGRYSHTAVWTGTEMIIWGGQGGGSTGSRYDPVNDSWVPTSGVDAPDGRMQHTAVWTGTEMIVWGGQGVFITRPLDTGGRYCAM